MKLNTASIKQKASKIYLDLSKKQSRHREIAAEIYINFIKFMESYKKKYQHKTEVTADFIKKIVKLISLKLIKKEKNNRKDQDFYINIMSQEYFQKFTEKNEKNISESGYRFFCAFIAQYQNRGENFKEYFIYFLLYYSQYIPKNMSMTAALMLGYSVTRFNFWAEEIEEQTEKRVLENCLPKRKKQNAKIIKNSTDKSRRFDSNTSHILPSIPLMGQILDTNSRKIAYGIRKITGMMTKAYKIYNTTFKIKNIKGPHYLLK